jgi:hypothetical protein
MNPRQIMRVLLAIVATSLIAALVSACDDPPYILRPVVVGGSQNQSNVTGAVTLGVQFSDPKAAPKAVDFLVDGKLVATVYDAAYQITWQTEKVANGEHALQARAHVADDKILSSPVTNVTVNNPTPPKPAG